MQKAPSVSVRGLSLRGAALGPKVRVRKKKAPHLAEPPRPASPGAVVPAFTLIATVDALVKELRKSLHAMFATLDPNVPTTNLYDNCSQQAFRFFTTTNTITPEAFHHKINKLGLHASQRLCLELFRLVDQEDLGELTYATFAHRIFLPAGYFNFSKPVTPEQAASPRPASARKHHTPLEGATSPRGYASGSVASSLSPRGATRGSGHSSGGLNSGGQHTPVPLIYENTSLSEIEKCISRKLEQHTSRSTDRFRQAFRIFTKSEGITFREFAHHLAAMQIHLSERKCRELFDRFDLDHNGTIELSEFTAALFRHEENEATLLGEPSSPPGGSHHHAFRLEDFEVEAGSSLTIQEILARLRDKLEQHTSKETDRFRQAFRIFGKSSGILPHEFNAAMAKLGLKLSERQVRELFELFDFDKSGDLDLNEFVQGVMLDDSTQHWLSIKDKHKVEESRRKRYSMAVQSVQSSWTIADIERMLREKIEQRTSRSSDCFRQAFRIFGKVNGINPDEFHAALEAIGLALDRSQSDILFQRFDQNGSGDIDLDEFIHAVLPPDYTGRQWVAAADELHREADQKRKQDAKKRPDRYMTEIEMENWSLDEIERRIRDKIQQATSKSSDTFRQAYKIFKKCNHVSIDDFRESLLALGFRLTPSQCAGLFRRYDTNNSNDIDLQEFCLRILPPDYTGDGDHWSHSDKYHRQRQQEKLEYVKRSKNGLLQLPKFDEARVRYTRGHHDRRNFDDLNSDAGEDAAPDGVGAAPSVELIRPASPATPGRPMTPRARPPSAQNQRPSSATSSSGSLSSPRLARPPTPKSPRPNVGPASPSPAATPLSPRVSRLNSSGSTNGLNDNNYHHSSSSSPRPLSATSRPASPRTYAPSGAAPPLHRPMSPRQPAGASLDACASPRRPTTPRAPPATARQPRPSEPYADEYADVEILEDTEERDDADDADERLTSQSLRALRARRSEAAARHHRASHGGPKSARGDAVSVSGESTASFSSSVQRAVGGAKYTPTHSNALLLQRFIRVAAKREAAANSTQTRPTAGATAARQAAAAAEAARRARPRRPHTTRL